MVDYSETIEVYDIKVGIQNKLNEYREIDMYQRSRSFFDLKPLDRLKLIYILSLHETRNRNR